MTTASSAPVTSNPFDLKSINFFERFNHESEREFAHKIYTDFEMRVPSEKTTLTFPVESDDLNLVYSILALKEFFIQNWLGPRTPFSHPLFDYISSKMQGKTHWLW